MMGPAYLKGESVFVRGWFAVRGLDQQPRDIDVTVDEAYVVKALSGIQRSDVKSALGDTRFSHVGFMGLVSTLNLELGTHTLRVGTSQDGAGQRYEMTATAKFEIESAASALSRFGSAPQGRMRGHVDEIRVDVIKGDGGDDVLSIFARGWACDLERRRPAAEVIGHIPDGSSSRSVIGFARPDIVIALGDPAFENCGYRLRIFTRSRSFAREDLRITALSADGRHQGNFWNGKVG